MNDPVDLAALLPPPDRLALFLDVDGTLIGPKHGDREAGIGPERIALLERLLHLTGRATVILTGRAVDTVDSFFAPLQLPAAGLQGVDRRFPNGRRVIPVLTADQRRMFEGIAEEVARHHPRFEMEWKPGGMALVHDEGDPDARTVIDLARRHVKGTFKVLPGRVAIDVVPLDADKGAALTRFMAETELAGRIPVHVGDDVPDEPAFAAAHKMGGFGIAVSRPVDWLDHLLADHEAVWTMLEAYAERF